VYYYKDGDTEYECEIYTDMNGQKGYQVYKRILCKNDTNPMIKELNEILERLKIVEETLNVKPTTNITDGSTEMQ
jgi:paraquat-inducible protein B